MQKQTIIGICGFANSGKDTAADILVAKYGFTKLSFAGILKDIIAIIFDWNRELLEGSTKQSRLWREQPDQYWSLKLKKEITPRWILQHIGTDVFRKHFDDKIWIYCLERQLIKYQKIVITDCRFPNEIELIKTNGGKMMKIFRNGNVSLHNRLKESIKDGIVTDKIIEQMHPSEYMWIPCDADHLISNEGTLQELDEKLKYLLSIQI